MKKLLAGRENTFLRCGIAIIFFISAISFYVTPVFADVNYQFDLYNLTLDQGGSLENFSMIIQTNDYITTTWMQALGYTITTSYDSLGYDINYFGTNKSGNFGFDDNGSAYLGESGFGWNMGFFIIPDHVTTDYITSPGVWDGNVIGTAFSNYNYFNGRATVTVSEVPEPATMLLLGLGLMGLAGVRRKFKK